MATDSVLVKSNYRLDAQADHVSLDYPSNRLCLPFHIWVVLKLGHVAHSHVLGAHQQHLGTGPQFGPSQVSFLVIIPVGQTQQVHLAVLATAQGQNGGPKEHAFVIGMGGHN